MTTTSLYTGGGVSLSPVCAEGRTLSAYVRLAAAEGKALQKGAIITPCVDVPAADAVNWTEIDEPPEELDDAEALA